MADPLFRERRRRHVASDPGSVADPLVMAGGSDVYYMAAVSLYAPDIQKAVKKFLEKKRGKKKRFKEYSFAN